MAAENFLIKNSSNRKAVEAISESFPQLDIIAPLALIIEPVDPVYAGTFVIASQQKEILGILNFVSQKETNGLK